MADEVLYRKAQIYLTQNDYIKAIEDFDQIIDRFSKSQWLDDAYLGKASALFDSGKNDLALIWYKNLIKVFPQSKLAPKAYYALGNIYQAQAEYSVAFDNFRLSYETSDEDDIKVGAVLKMADTRMLQKDYKAATELYDIVLKKYSENRMIDYAQYQLGVALYQMKNYRGSILSLQSMILNFHDSNLIIEAQYQLGLAYFKIGDYEKARLEFSKVLNSQAKHLHFDALLQTGNSFYNDKQFEQALASFEKVIKNYPGRPDLWKARYEIAWCYYQLGAEKKALEEFTLLLDKYPDLEIAPDISFWIGQYFYNQDKLDKAKEYFLGVVEGFPKSDVRDQALYWLGWTSYKAADYKNAINCFKRVSVEYPDSNLAKESLLNTGRILTERAEYDSAVAKFEELIQKSESGALKKAAYINIAEIMRRQKFYDKAIENYRKALTISDKQADAQIRLDIAECMEALGDKKAAASEYLDISYAYSYDSAIMSKALVKAAELFSENGQAEPARRAYEKIVQLNTEESKLAQQKFKQIPLKLNEEVAR